MRSLNRDLQTVFYSLQIPNAKRDKNGNLVADFTVPFKGRFTLSANKGEASMQPFGREVDYDRQMITHNMNCPIDEYSRLWIDISPSDNATYNYIVTKVARSQNVINYAIKKVSTS